MTGKIRWTVILGMLLVLATGCGKKTVKAPVLAPPPPPPAPTAMEMGDEKLANDDPESAIQHYQSYLAGNPTAPDRDAALFRTALANALKSRSDYQPARILFKQVIALFPRSPYAAESRLILKILDDLARNAAALQDKTAETDKIRGELERLKKIDMERRPVRPPR